MFETQCEMSAVFRMSFHLLVLQVVVHCVLSGPKSIQQFTRRYYVDKQYRDPVFLFHQHLSTVQTTTKWFTHHIITVLDWSANLPDQNPKDNSPFSTGYCLEEGEKHWSQKYREPEGCNQSSRITKSQQCQ